MPGRVFGELRIAAVEAQEQAGACELGLEARRDAVGREDGVRARLDDALENRRRIVKRRQDIEPRSVVHRHDYRAPVGPK